MQLLAQSPWDYDLYQEGDRILLTVVCGTVGIFEITVELTPAERALWEANGADGLSSLVQAIRDNPAAFQARAVL